MQIDSLAFLQRIFSRTHSAASFFFFIIFPWNQSLSTRFLPESRSNLEASFLPRQEDDQSGADIESLANERIHKEHTTFYTYIYVYEGKVAAGWGGWCFWDACDTHFPSVCFVSSSDFFPFQPRSPFPPFFLLLFSFALWLRFIGSKEARHSACLRTRGWARLSYSKTIEIKYNWN